MPKGTGAHLKIKKMGDNVLGVELLGDPKKPEPIHFRLQLPFGEVDVVRTSDKEDPEWWVHISLNSPVDGGSPARRMGQFVDARMDIRDKHVNEADLGDFDNDLLTHIAFRIGPTNMSAKEAMAKAREFFKCR